MPIPKALGHALLTCFVIRTVVHNRQQRRSRGCDFHHSQHCHDTTHIVTSTSCAYYSFTRTPLQVLIGIKPEKQTRCRTVFASFPIFFRIGNIEISYRYFTGVAGPRPDAAALLSLTVRHFPHIGASMRSDVIRHTTERRRCQIETYGCAA